MRPTFKQGFRKIRLFRFTHGCDELQLRHVMALARGDHRDARTYFGGAARMRLQHAAGTAHLSHVLAALPFLRRHRSFREHAGQQWCSRPKNGEERKRDGDTSSHSVSLRYPHPRSM